MGAPWSIDAAHHVGLHVSDLDRSLRFYRDLLGFELVVRWTPVGEYVGTLVGYDDHDIEAALLRPPGADALLELVHLRGVSAPPADAAAAPAGTAHLAFAVTDLDALFAVLTAEGVRSISDPVTPTRGPNEGGRVVNVLDPDGVRVELIQSPRAFDAFEPSA